jgi:lipase
VRRTLALHTWGEEGSPRVVCLHGVTSHGRHFAGLAERLADRFHVQALDLLGHGDSPREPPWDIDAQLDAILATAGERPASLVGHSFGGRLAFELAARRPELVERLVLLDPAILLLPDWGLASAENARADRSYATFAEGIDRRYEESRLAAAPREPLEHELAVHLVESEDGRWRYRYLQSAVIAAYGEMCREPPPFAAVTAPTLVLLGDTSYLPYDHLLEAHREAAGDLLEVRTLRSGHTLLWDAAAETIEAVSAFLDG